MKNIAKEFYAGKTKDSSDLSVTFILENDEEFKLQISRDVAINIIEALYFSLDTKGTYRPRDVH